jgi:hypothetical protein
MKKTVHCGIRLYLSLLKQCTVHGTSLSTGEINCNVNEHNPLNTLVTQQGITLYSIIISDYCSFFAT